MSLLEFVRVGIPSAHEHFVGKFADAIEELIARPTFGSDEERATARKRLSADAQKGADSTVEDAITTADAAGFVFMHSMLDCSVDDYCEITALLSPTAWRSCVDGEKVSFAQAQGDQDALLRDLVGRYVKSLRNQSLPNKIAALLAVCKPGICLQCQARDAAPPRERCAARPFGMISAPTTRGERFARRSAGSLT